MASKSDVLHEKISCENYLNDTEADLRPLRSYDGNNCYVRSQYNLFLDGE